MRVISITAAGVSRAWRFKIGVFQGSPLSPRVYLYQEKIYLEAVGSEDTGFPPFPTSTGKFRDLSVFFFDSNHDLSPDTPAVSPSQRPRPQKDMQ